MKIRIIFSPDMNFDIIKQILELVSGPICPDCRTNHFNELKFGKLQCQLCQWKGKGLPRKSIGTEKSKKMRDRFQRLKSMKEEGKIYFLRIKMRGSEEIQDDDIFEIMDILDIESVSSGNPRFIIANGKPIKAQMDKIKKLKSVRKISIY